MIIKAIIYMCVYISGRKIQKSLKEKVKLPPVSP